MYSCRERRDHRTVLLSSHLLAEVEQLCDRVGVIREGRLIAEGTVAELRDRAGDAGLVITADPLERAAELVRGLPEVRSADTAGGVLRVGVDPGRAAEVNRLLVESGVDVTELRQYRVSLEETFLELVRDRPHAPRVPEPVPAPGPEPASARAAHPEPEPAETSKR